MSPLIKPHPLSISIALLAALPLTAPPIWAQQTNLITNGSFERGTDPGAQYTTLSAGSTNIAGWTVVTSTTVDYVANTFWQTSEGQRSVDLNGTSAGTLSQSFPTEKGKQYQVLFDLAGNPNGSAMKYFNVSAGNYSQTVSFNAASSTYSQIGYQEKSLVFTATAETSTLTFASLNSGAHGAVIDNVRVFPFQAVANTDNCLSNSQTVTFQPALKWKWTGSSVLPYHNQVMHAPIVAPLLLEDTNGDGKINYSDAPSVIFQAFAGSNYTSNGVLRAVSGKDGHELWTVTDSKYRTNPASEIAVADIDNDGKVEIVVPKNGASMMAFEHDGTFKWQSAFPANVNWGGPAIADLDGNGKPEIVVGNTVLNADGSLLWEGQGFNGNSLSVAADINLDGKPEVIAGAAAYSNTGSLLWQNSKVGDGFVALGNFNNDKYPEIAIVSHGRVFLLNSFGEIIWGPVLIPGGGHGGAPTIADMDGDGKPNIGVAGAWRYVVFKEDGNVLWTTVISDGSSNVTGSSVFDFNGDGQAEVVYADEHYLRLYRGKDGTVLAQVPNSSATTYELPAITDVDNDGHADIVLSTNNYAYGSNGTGIRVYQDERNTWMKTRPLWNQHSYHVTNINDDGSVPRFEKNSWQASNTYRLNILNKIAGGLPLAKDCPVTPAGCQLYGVNDQDTNNSQFLSLQVSNSLVTSNLSNTDVGPLCEKVWEGYDIEGLAIDTAKNILYASSGDDVGLGRPAGHLYSVDAKNCQLFSIGETGFDEVASLAITRDGTLYGWAKGQGLIVINPDTGEGTLVLPSEVELEDLTASREQNVLYGAVNRDLWKYQIDTQTLEVLCTNLPGQTEGMAVLSEGLLLVAIHQDDSLRFVETNQVENGKCNILKGATISTSNRFEDVEGLAVPSNVCSVWGTQLFKELQGDLPDEIYRARLRTLFGEFVDLPKVDVPPKTPSEIISQLPKEELKKFLTDLQQRIFKEYIGKVSDAKIQEFFDELPTELPAGYSNGIADKIVLNLPKRVREQFEGEMSVPKLTMLVEERLNGFLDEVSGIKKLYVINSLFTPKQIRDIALVPALNWAIKGLVEDIADRLSLYLVAEVVNQLPACFLSELIEKTED